MTWIYFIILFNGFFAGYVCGDEFRWANSPGEKVWVILKVLGLLVLGTPIVLLLIIYSFVTEKILKPIDGYFQIRFFFDYIFNRKSLMNLDENKLDLINRITENKKSGKSFRDRIYRYATSLVNKLNNYTYKNNTQ